MANPTIQIFEVDSEILIDENSQTNQLSVIISHSQGDLITLTCESTNHSLVSHSSFLLNYADHHILTTTLLPPPSPTSFIPLVIIPCQNQYGRTTITLQIKDSNNASDSVSFDLIVNGRPQISTIIDHTMSSLNPFEIYFNIFDPETPCDDLDISIQTSQPDILPADNITLNFLNQDSNAKLTLYPIIGKTGHVQISLQVSDKRLKSRQQFQLKIYSLPVAYLPSQWTIPLNSTSTPIPMSICSADDGNVTITIQSTDIELIQNEKISMGISQTNSISLTLDTLICMDLKIYVQPEKNRIGNVILDVIIDNDVFVEKKELLLTVNSPPEIIPPQAQVMNKNTLASPVVLTVIDDDTSFTELELSLNTNCSSLLNDIDYFFTSNTCTLLLTPVTNQSGTCQISASVSDGVDSDFALIDIRVNECPFIDQIEDQRTDEDKVLQIFTNISDDDALNTHQWKLEFNNPQLVSDYDVQLNTDNQFVILSLYPSKNISGQTMVTVIMTDSNNLSYSRSFLWEVTPVDDDPELSGLLSCYCIEENTSLTMTFQLFDIDTPVQELEIIVSSSNTDLLPLENIFIQPQGEKRIMEVLPIAGQSGETDIVVKVFNAHFPESYQLYPMNLTVVPKNVPPVILPKYSLTVNIAGDFSQNDYYEYTVLNATGNEAIVSGHSQDDQFVETLQEGSYQLIIFAAGYEPYTYSLNDNRIITMNEHSEITCYLYKNDLSTNDDGGCFIRGLDIFRHFLF